MNIGRRLYYITITGEIVIDTGERSGDVISTTVDDDFQIYAALARFNREALGVMELEYGQFKEDFQKCNGVRVDITGAEPALLFSFPSEPGEEQPEEPVYQPPTLQRLASLETDSINTMIAVTESFETQQAADGQREQETTNTMLALAEAYEIILQQQEVMASMAARIDALETQKGGVS